MNSIGSVKCQLSAQLKFCQGWWWIRERDVGRTFSLDLFVFKTVKNLVSLCASFSNISKENILNDHWLWKVYSFFFILYLEMLPSNIQFDCSCFPLTPSLTMISLHCIDGLLIISVLGFKLHIHNEALKYVAWYLGVLCCRCFITKLTSSYWAIKIVENWMLGRTRFENVDCRVIHIQKEYENRNGDCSDVIIV